MGRVGNFLARLREWGNREHFIVSNLRQTKKGTAFDPYPIKLKGTVIGEMQSELTENNGCYRVTNHPSWYEQVFETKDIDHRTVNKQLIKSPEGCAILITNGAEKA